MPHQDEDSLDRESREQIKDDREQRAESREDRSWAFRESSRGGSFIKKILHLAVWDPTLLD
jgi:hypothetical protein